MKVPLVDLRASYLPIREALLAEFDEILMGMELFLGPNVRAFEEEFAAHCEAAHGVGTLKSLTDSEWESLTPVGSLQVKPIAFGRGNARLNVQSQRDIKDLARRLRSLPQYYLSVVGHARAEGDPEANFTLARERANAASAYLVEQGVDPNRVRAVAARPMGTGGGLQAVSFTLAQQPY